ncbi:MAG: NADH-quinone oxidoreductase subunit N [Ignavibacterium sp.]
MNFTSDLFLIYPEIVLTATLIVVVLFDLIFKRSQVWLPVLSLAGILTAFILVVLQFGTNLPAFEYSTKNNLLSIDNLSTYFKGIILLSSFFVVLFSIFSSEVKSCKDRHGEYYSLLLGMMIGMFFLVSSNDLILIYLSMELLSLSSYVLAGFVKNSIRNSEASLKYVIYGSVSSGIMLFGISLLYGLTGTTNLNEINTILRGATTIDITFILSVFMILAGFGFKISVVPFHFWTPDVYEGAPITITAYLSVASKAAGFAVLIRFIKSVFFSGISQGGYWNLFSYFDWQSVLVLISIVTMTLGNFSALWQDNLKRMLAYSSIAHAGYILLGVAVLSDQGITAVLIYFAIYMFMNLGAFLIVMLIANKIGSENIDDYKGLGYSIPFLGTALAIFLVSLTGLPPTAGFIAKLYLFIALVDAKMIVVAIIALLNTVVSLYYYIRVLKNMYLVRDLSKSVHIELKPLSFITILLLVIPVLLFGVYFTPIVDFAKLSIQILGL